MINIKIDMFDRGLCNKGHNLKRYSYEVCVNRNHINFIYLLYCPTCKVYFIGYRRYTRTADQHVIRNLYYYTQDEMLDAMKTLQNSKRS